MSASTVGTAACSQKFVPPIWKSSSSSTCATCPISSLDLEEPEADDASFDDSPCSSPKLETVGSCVRLPAICLQSPSHHQRGAGGITRAQLAVTFFSQLEGLEATVELFEGEGDRSTGIQPADGAIRLLTEEPVRTAYRSSGAIIGIVRVSDAPAIPFGVQVPKPGTAGLERLNFVAEEHRQRSVIAHASNLEFAGLHAKGDGFVVEIAVNDGFQAEMAVAVRKAKKKELTRLAQKQQLEHAMEKKNYSNLMAQISRSRMRKVETSMIAQASRLLKSLRPADGTFLTHKELAKLMKWKRVTSPSEGTSDTTDCCAMSDDCPCNAGQGEDGEICEVTSGTLLQALEGVAPSGTSADKWLFQGLVKAALLAPEGCVWKSGGKFLLTNEERNQSATAIVGVLERDNQESEAGKGIRALVEYTENAYNVRVTAVQLNFHPNNKSSHKQHRDIYGAGQKAGINCTCTFMKCTGTVCYSLGSSRQVLTETIADGRSKYEPCGEGCSGCKVHRWMHSGSAMYFNAPWNNNHTHGIPCLEEPCGPRISVALLCA